MRLKALHSAILINIFMFSLVAAGQNSRKFTVSGYVTDIESGESLIGAGVLSGGEAKTGVSTNEFGWYNVSLREGRTTIEYHSDDDRVPLRWLRAKDDCLRPEQRHSDKRNPLPFHNTQRGSRSGKEQRRNQIH